MPIFYLKLTFLLILIIGSIWVSEEISNLVFKAENLFLDCRSFNEIEEALSMSFFFLIWCCHVSLLSMVRPKYLTVSKWGWDLSS